MAMIGVRFATIGLALAVLCPSPQACAFGLRFGPFLLGGRAHHHHHRHVVRRPTEALHPEATPTEDVAQNRAPSLLYPILAWPSFADDIFWPTDHSSWPFSYQSIFDQAFAEYPPSVSPTYAPASSGRAMPLYTSGARSRRPLRKSRCCKNSAPPLRKPTAI